MRSPGIIVNRDCGLTKILEPLSVQISTACWVVSVQAGPFSSTWLYDSPENEAKVERKFLAVPALEDTDMSCWRPHTFPRLSQHIIIDEWSYFFAMCCSEDEAQNRAGLICKLFGKPSDIFFDQLPSLSDLFLCHVDGWWECYTHHEDWRSKISSAYPEAFERTWRHAFEPPSFRPR